MATFLGSNSTNGCKVTTIIDGSAVKVKTACPVYGITRATYERDDEDTMPMINFAQFCKSLAMDDHKEQHDGG